MGYRPDFWVSGQYSLSEQGSAESGISPQYSEFESQPILGGGDGGGGGDELDSPAPPHPVITTTMLANKEAFLTKPENPLSYVQIYSVR
jgi:hypothetical protein